MRANTRAGSRRLLAVSSVQMQALEENKIGSADQSKEPIKQTSRA